LPHKGDAMSKKSDKEEMIDSIKSLIISYNVQIEREEDHVVELRKERSILKERLLKEE
jgi:hypothetical protein